MLRTRHGRSEPTQQLSLVVVLAALLACGKEVGRIPFSDAGSGSTRLPLEAKEIALWTSLDIEYEGSFAPRYEVELVDGGTVAKTTCNPLDVSTKMSKTAPSRSARVRPS